MSFYLHHVEEALEVDVERTYRSTVDKIAEHSIISGRPEIRLTFGPFCRLSDSAEYSDRQAI